MTETPADRLRKLRLKKGYETATDAARAFGWNEATYTSHENETRGIRSAVAQKYARAFNSTAAYIMHGTNGSPAETVNHVDTVPLVGVVSAGVFLESDTLDFGEVTVPVVPRKDIPGAAQYALKVAGESVNRKIPDGAFAICASFDRYPGGAEHGMLVHVVRERAGLHEHTIKEVRYTKDGAYLMPVSSHPDHQEPIALDGDESTTIRIHGVVIGSYFPF